MKILELLSASIQDRSIRLDILKAQNAPREERAEAYLEIRDLKVVRANLECKREMLEKRSGLGAPTPRPVAMN